MIRLEKNKLIIEIDSMGGSPLAMLYNFQSGLINILQVADTFAKDNPPYQVYNGLYFAKRLLEEMILTETQNEILEGSLTANELEKFNKPDESIIELRSVKHYQ